MRRVDKVAGVALSPNYRFKTAEGIDHRLAKRMVSPGDRRSLTNYCGRTESTTYSEANAGMKQLRTKICYEISGATALIPKIWTEQGLITVTSTLFDRQYDCSLTVTNLHALDYK